MLKENEVIMLILGIGVFFFILLNFEHVKRIKYWRILTASFIMLLLGWFFTVIEGFIWEKFLNFSEHICYAIGSVFILLWCLKSTGKKEAAS